MTFEHAEEVTTSDTAELATPARALYIGAAGGGLLKITDLTDNVVSFVGVAAGFFWVGAKQVHQTGTDVTSIVALS